MQLKTTMVVDLFKSVYSLKIVSDDEVAAELASRQSRFEQVLHALSQSLATEDPKSGGFDRACKDVALLLTHFLNDMEVNPNNHGALLPRMRVHRGCYGPLGLLFGKPSWHVAVIADNKVEYGTHVHNMRDVLKVLRAQIMEGLLGRKFIGPECSKEWRQEMLSLEEHHKVLAKANGCDILTMLSHLMMVQNPPRIHVSAKGWDIEKTCSVSVTPEAIARACALYATCSTQDHVWYELDADALMGTRATEASIDPAASLRANELIYDGEHGSRISDIVALYHTLTIDSPV